MNKSYENSPEICDNTNLDPMETILDDMSNMDIPADKLPDETMGFPGSDSPKYEANIGGTLKEYEDQLTALRKDNFNLKLRIYFLEERLQNSNAPQSHDELYKKNLELKVKVGCLSRELKEHKNLLRSAAEAMEFTEQTAARKEAELNKNIIDLNMELKKMQSQNSMPPCEDSVLLYAEAFNLNKLSQPPKIQINDKTVELTNSSNNDDNENSLEAIEKKNNEIQKLKDENSKLLQLTQSCLERIKRLDKNDQKLKESLQRKEDRILMLQKELQQGTQDRACHQYNQESNILNYKEIERKYENIIQEKDKRISELEMSVNKFNTMHAQGDGMLNNENKNINVQEMLTKRLREMAYFLDSLISHRCIIGEEKQKRIENLLEESLRLPIDLELDPEASRLLENSLMDNTMGDKSIDILDLTNLLAHHVSLNETGRANPTIFKQEYSTNRNRNVMSNQSIDELAHGDSEHSSNLQKMQAAVREKEEVLEQLSQAREMISTMEKKCESIQSEYEATVENNHQQIQQLYHDIKLCRSELHSVQENSKHSLEELQIENNRLKDDKDEILAKMKSCLEEETSKYQELLNDQKKDLESKIEIIKNQKDELERRYEEVEKRNNEMESLMREVEKDKEDLMRKEEEFRRREEEILIRKMEFRRQEEEPVGDLREDVEDQVVVEADGTCPSPDRGIDSDRHSSLELPDSYSAQEEILALRGKLMETEQKLEAALRKLTPLQLHHHKVERAICKQIHKTTAVLREAKKNFNA